jgi:phosphoglycolate phosphatase-like HAD superfamily hydrolase
LAELISFDIDGTLEAGDPPGIITMDMVRRAKHGGYLIGSCSDRPVRFQQHIWDTHGITVDFTVLKHRLDEVRERFQAEAYYHIGDTDTDLYYADRAGFHFIWAEASALRSSGTGLFL